MAVNELGVTLQVEWTGAPVQVKVMSPLNLALRRHGNLMLAVPPREIVCVGVVTLRVKSSPFRERHVLRAIRSVVGQRDGRRARAAGSGLERDRNSAIRACCQ